MDYGTGFNAICPPYYLDDFNLACKNKLSRKGFLNEKGLIVGEDDIDKELNSKSFLEADNILLKK